MEKSDGDARAGAADGMAEGDGSAIDVELVAIEVKFTVAGEDLSGEGFVEFDEIEVSKLEAVFCFEFTDGRNGTNSHEARVDSGGCRGENSGEGPEIVLLDKFFAGENDCGCAIGDAGGVGGGDGSGLGKDGREFRHLF